MPVPGHPLPAVLVVSARSPSTRQLHEPAAPPGQSRCRSFTRKAGDEHPHPVVHPALGEQLRASRRRRSGSRCGPAHQAAKAVAGRRARVDLQRAPSGRRRPTNAVSGAVVRGRRRRTPASSSSLRNGAVRLRCGPSWRRLQRVEAAPAEVGRQAEVASSPRVVPRLVVASARSPSKNRRAARLAAASPSSGERGRHRRGAEDPVRRQRRRPTGWRPRPARGAGRAVGPPHAFENGVNTLYGSPPPVPHRGRVAPAYAEPDGRPASARRRPAPERPRRRGPIPYGPWSPVTKTCVGRPPRRRPGPTRRRVTGSHHRADRRIDSSRDREAADEERACGCRRPGRAAAGRRRTAGTTCPSAPAAASAASTSARWSDSRRCAPEPGDRRSGRRRFSRPSRRAGDERLLGDLDPADVLHLLLAFLLLLEQLALPRDVAAVALGQHVLALGLDRLAGDDLAADGRLDRARRTSAAGSAPCSFSVMLLAVVVGLVAVDDRAEGVGAARR